MLPESDYIYDFSFPKEDGKPNPHLWTDPTYAIKYAEVIKDTLVPSATRRTPTTTPPTTTRSSRRRPRCPTR